MRGVQATLALMLVGTTAALAQGGHVDLLAGPDSVKWAPVPENLPAGGQIAILYGDPSKEGPFVVRLKMPTGYQIPPHHHSMAESVTVISGDFAAGMGDKLNKAEAQSFKPGGFVWMPAKMNHYALANSEAVIQVQGQGPFDVVYVNAQDAPAKR